MADNYIESQKEYFDENPEENNAGTLRNIRRRVYDALNVQINLGIFVKENKKIMPTEESKLMGKVFHPRYKEYREIEDELF